MIPDLTQSRFEELSAYVAERGAGRWLVLGHDNPDPDALMSAAVLGRILDRGLGVPVTIAHGGIVGRAENQEMVRGLDLKFSLVRHINWRNYRHFALVDTQPRTGNNQLPDAITPDLVIDHHPQRKEAAQSPLVDIRPAYGATASIVAEYLLASGVSITRSAATGLVYAIQSETQSFSRESSGPDRLIYDRLHPLANKRALGRIQYPRLPLGYMQTLHDALESLQETGTWIVCHLSSVSAPDNVPEIADLLLRLEGKTWCLTTGPFEDRIYMALRTTNPRADAGRAMRRLVGRRGKGGGHGMIAGGWVPIDSRGSAESTQRRLGEKVLRMFKKDPSKLARVEVRKRDRSAATRD